jgi:hypothetical protein
MGKNFFSGIEDDMTSNLVKEPKMHDLFAGYKSLGFELTNYGTHNKIRMKKEGDELLFFV